MNSAPSAASASPPLAAALSIKGHRFRWGRWLGVLVVLGAVGFFIRAKFFTEGARDSHKYQTALVTRRHLREVVSASGTLNPLVSVTVGAEVSGVIRKVFVDFNSPVKAGQAIAQIDTLTYQAALTQAEGDLANAQASLKLAQANLQRKKELFERKMLAASDYDTTVAAVEQAEATITTRLGARDKAKADLDHCTIFSPIDGVVTNRAVDVGQTVASSFSTPTLFTIVNDLRNMQIDASVAEADIGGIVVGQPVEFSVDAYPTMTFHGSVKVVHNAPVLATTSSSSSTTTTSSSTTGVVTYDSVIAVDNTDLKLKPGMTASVSVVIADRADALAVPNAALRFTPPAAPSASPADTLSPAAELPPLPPADGHRIYQTQEDASKKDNSTSGLVAREIMTGITDGATTEVLAGLGAGDKVVVAVLSGTSSRGAAGGPPPGGGPR